MTNNTSISVLQRAQSVLSEYPGSVFGAAFMQCQPPCWEIKRQNHENLQIDYTYQWDNRFAQDFPLLSYFGENNNEFSEFNLANFAELNVLRSIQLRLSQSPFRLHFYTEDMTIVKNEVEVNNILTLLQGSLTTELISGTNNIKQQGKPGEIIVGHKRDAGAEHLTKVKKGSVVLFRQDDNYNSEPSLTFHQDLTFLYELNACPVLVPSENKVTGGRFEFDIHWELYGDSIEKLDLGVLDSRRTVDSDQVLQR